MSSDISGYYARSKGKKPTIGYILKEPSATKLRYVWGNTNEQNAQKIVNPYFST